MNAIPSERTLPKRVRLPISWKLLAATVVVGVVAVAIAVAGLRQMNMLNLRLTRAIDYSSDKVKLAAVLKQDLVSVTRAEKTMILASSVPEMRRISAAIEATLASMKQHENELRLLVDDQDRE
ncbi:MAG: hypothetical protein AB7F89_20145, partial [Pirellulaceae bacterium]